MDNLIEYVEGNDNKDFDYEEFDQNLMEDYEETESKITNFKIIEKDKREYNKRWIQ